MIFNTSSIKNFLKTTGFFPKQQIEKFIESPKEINQEGSLRHYFRINEDFVFCYAEDDQARLMQKNYFKLFPFYKQAGIAVPEGKIHNPDFSYSIIQYAGEKDFTCLNKEKYHLALDIVKDTLDRLRSSSTHNWPITGMLNKERLTKELFFMHSQIKSDSQLTESLPPIFQQILANIPEGEFVLCHRDYHHRNWLYHEREDSFYLIDFQDTMLGSQAYDAVSFAFDPYMDLTWTERIKLVEKLTDANPKEIFYVALQRILKALGSFLYFTQVKNLDKYKKVIPQTKKILCNFITFAESYSLDKKAKELAKQIKTLIKE